MMCFNEMSPAGLNGDVVLRKIIHYCFVCVITFAV